MEPFFMLFGDFTEHIFNTKMIGFVPHPHTLDRKNRKRGTQNPKMAKCFPNLAILFEAH